MCPRGACSALRRGEIYFRAAHDTSNGGVLAFSRIDGGHEALVISNTSGDWKKIDRLVIDSALNKNRPFARWKNLYNGNEFGTVGQYGDVTALYLGKISQNGTPEEFYMAPESVAIFVDESNMTAWNGDLGAHLCKE